MNEPRLLPLSYNEIRAFLEKLELELEKLVLVGGQAVNFWAERYLHRVPELRDQAPYTSKDIDFYGDRKSVQAWAERVGGKAYLPEPFEPTPNSGVLVFVDDNGQSWTVDFLHGVHGVKDDQLKKLAIPVELEDDDGKPIGIELRVLHPWLCMQSRANNIVSLPGYGTEHAFKQFRASVFCAREFLRDLLDDGYVREVLKLNERIFRFSRHAVGVKAKALTAVDPFDAVLADPRLPPTFAAVRYPQMQAQLRRRRGDES